MGKNKDEIGFSQCKMLDQTKLKQKTDKCRFIGRSSLVDSQVPKNKAREDTHLN